MRVWLSVCLLFVCVACEPKPSAEDIAAQEQAAVAARTPVPTPKPKPGDWMLKNYQNPLEPKKKPGQR